MPTLPVLNRLFEGSEYPLEVFNQQAIINQSFYFFVDDCGTETGFDFPDYVSSFFRVFNERLGRRLLNEPLTRSTSYLVLNISGAKMSFDDNGDYHYEIGYTMSGGYEQVLRYGKLKMI